MNAAFQKRLQFTKERVYRSNQTFVPSGIDIDINDATIKPSLSPQADKAIFTFTPLKNDPVTGLYTGSNQNVIAPAKKFAGKVTIHGGNADMENTLMYFTTSDITNTKNTQVDDIVVTDMKIMNISRSAFKASADQLFTDSSGVYNNVHFTNNTVKYNIGDGLYVTQDQSVGDTLIHIQTLGKDAIASRLMRGKDIQFGYKGTSGLDVTGYATSNAYFKIIDYTIDSNDSSKAVIKVYGGSYDGTNGWIVNTDYKGLRVNIVKNAMVMPIYQEGGSLLFSHPSYTGSLGSTTLTRSQSSTQQSAYQKNVIAGMKFSIDGLGTYTVTDVYADSVHITPGLKTTVSDKAMQAHYFPCALMSVYGYVRNSYVLDNDLDGGDHSIQFVGAGKKNTFPEDIDNRVYINDNDAKRAWMNVEGVIGTSVRTSYTSVLSNASFTKGDTSYTPATPSRIGSKDMGSGAVKFITLSATIDANVTNTNSLFVGDIIAAAGLNEKLKVVDVYTNGGGDPTISFRRWDQFLRDTVTGGIEATRSSIASCYRVFNVELGAMGVYRLVEMKRNTFSYPMRNSGGVGYCISIGGHEADVESNTFNVSEVNPIELHANIIRFTNSNKINAEVFDGSKPVPGLTKTAGVTGKGYSFGAFVGTDITIKDNIFTGSQPSGYQARSGSFLIQPDSYTLYPLRSVSVIHNVLDGMLNNIINVNGTDRQTINGTSYPVFAYKEQYIQDNAISTLPYSFINDGIFQNIIAAKYRVTNNTIVKRGVKLASINVLKANEKPNVELVDSTAAYDIRISDNIYDTTANLNSDYVRTHAGVYWADNRPTLDRSETFFNKLLDNPSFQNFTGSGNLIQFNPSTGKLERVSSISEPFADAFGLFGTGTNKDTASFRINRTNRFVGMGNVSSSPTNSLQIITDSAISINANILLKQTATTGTRSSKISLLDGLNEGVFAGYNGTYGDVGTIGAHAQYFSSNSTRRMVISSGGNIGIRNLIPNEMLAIGAAGDPGLFALYDNAGNKVTYKAPAIITSSFTTYLPSTKPSVGQVMKVVSVVGNDVTVEYGTDNTGGGGGGTSGQGTVNF